MLLRAPPLLISNVTELGNLRVGRAGRVEYSRRSEMPNVRRRAGGRMRMRMVQPPQLRRLGCGCPHDPVPAPGAGPSPQQ